MKKYVKPRVKKSKVTNTPHCAADKHCTSCC